jgi:uncharacterized protein YndB with AHSA1/START domain
MMEATDTAVRREVTVQAPPERAFEVFANGFNSWWPRGHSLLEADLDEVIIEPPVGGRWYERAVDGSECVWGEVLAYEPPTRLVLTWRIGGDFKLEENAASEIEVTFTPVGDGATRVELAHRHFERHALGAQLAESVGAEGGWGTLLQAYADAVA